MTPSDNQETGVPLWGFLAGAAIVIVAAFVAVWVMFPAPDTRHDLLSPSGAVRLELGELCGDMGCDRVAILDVEGVRRGCPLALEDDRPLFSAVTAAWSDAEAEVTLHYVAEDGSAGSLRIERAGCTITQ